VRRYFEFMGAVGTPRIWSFRCAWTGGFRRRPDAPFWPCEAWQYDTRTEIARVCRLRMRVAPLVHLVARDSYAGGQGRMRATVLGWPVVDARGPELDLGELVTYLNDAILFAPSLLLGPEAGFCAVDDCSFDVTLRDRGRQVRARVFTNGDGAPVSFRTGDRFVEDPAAGGAWRRTEWVTPVDGWQSVGGRRLPTTGRATWLLPSGPFTYVELAIVPASFVVNVQSPANA
jgi:uncharacterized protein DUF6544